jgi:flagellar biosynthesis component FlhA
VNLAARNAETGTAKNPDGNSHAMTAETKDPVEMDVLESPTSPKSPVAMAARTTRQNAASTRKKGDLKMKIKQLVFTMATAMLSIMSAQAQFATIKEEKFVVNLSEEILEVISMEANDNLLEETVKIRQKLADSLGYVIPHIHFHNSDDLNQNEFSIKIHDIELFRTVVFPGYVAYYKDEFKGYKVTQEDIVVNDEITYKK